jgi:hypothetical protein
VDYRIHLVQGWHRTLLGRAADLPRLMQCVQFLAAGGAVVRLKEALLALPEYFSHCGGDTDAGFLEALYRDVLGRAIRPPELEADGRRLQDGATRAAVVGQVLAGAEAQQALVRGWYHRLLRRPAEPAMLDTHAEFLRQGGREEDVLLHLIGSGEYLDLAQEDDPSPGPRRTGQ